MDCPRSKTKTVRTDGFLYLWFLFASAGAGRTGTFCALSTVLERVKAEGILDVFQTVKSLRLQRPHMVQTLVSATDTSCHPRPQQEWAGDSMLSKNFLG